MVSDEAIVLSLYSWRILTGVPLVRQVEFRIDLVPGVAPVAKAPYRLMRSNERTSCSIFWVCQLKRLKACFPFVVHILLNIYSCVRESLFSNHHRFPLLQTRLHYFIDSRNSTSLFDLVSLEKLLTNQDDFSTIRFCLSP